MPKQTFKTVAAVHVLFDCILVLLLLASWILAPANAHYFPGVIPHRFQPGDAIPLTVNALTSVHTLIPKDYYRLPFCQPEGGPVLQRQNLGQTLTGNRIYNSPYEIKLLQETRCRKLCQVTLTKAQAALLQDHIQMNYHHQWILDNLPSANMVAFGDGRTMARYAGGFPIGIGATTGAYLYNHANIVVDYNGGDKGYRVVEFAVEPLSVAHQWKDDSFQCQSSQNASSTLSSVLKRDYVGTLQKVEPGATILFTYDVTWRASQVPWSNRWDIYLDEDDLVPDQVHWYSIVNSIIVIVVLSVAVTCILVRNLRKDVMASRGRGTPSTDGRTTMGEMEDEKGWKALYGDVFRPPQTMPMLLCVFVGTGIHLAVTCFGVVFSAMLGVLSPARRGSLLQAILIIYALCSSVSGYASSRLYKSLGGQDWKACRWLTAILFPGIVFAVFLLFNVWLAMFDSTGSVPLTSILAVAGMWCCVSIPLAWLGSNVALNDSQPISFPTAVRNVVRPIPAPSVLWKTPVLSMMLVGLFPFAAAYVELFFILTCLWMDQFYYVFGFAMIVYLILMVTCSQVTIIAVYYRLKAENHQWWWQSFFWSGSIGFYLFFFSIFWFQTVEAAGEFLTYLLYFGYMFLLSFAAFLLFGAVGFACTLLFVRRIYTVVNETDEGYIELLAEDPLASHDLSLFATEQGDGVL